MIHHKSRRKGSTWRMSSKRRTKWTIQLALSVSASLSFVVKAYFRLISWVLCMGLGLTFVLSIPEHRVPKWGARQTKLHSFLSVRNKSPLYHIQESWTTKSEGSWIDPRSFLSWTAICLADLATGDFVSSAIRTLICWGQLAQIAVNVLDLGRIMDSNKAKFRRLEMLSRRQFKHWFLRTFGLNAINIRDLGTILHGLEYVFILAFIWSY